MGESTQVQLISQLAGCMISKIKRAADAPELAQPAADYDVWAVSTTVNSGSVLGKYTVQSVSVPLDDAVELSNPVWGGPLLISMPCMQTLLPWSRAVVWAQWAVVIYAFIPEEAIGALHQLDDLLQRHVTITEVLGDSRLRARIRDGQITSLGPGECVAWQV